MAASITPFLETLEAIDSSYDRRREIDKLRDAKVEYQITITAKEVEQNYSYVREDGYRGGFGFLGTVPGIVSEVKILLPTSLNDQAQAWNAGEEHSFTVRFLDWDSPYKQYKLLGTGINRTSPPATPASPDTTTKTPEQKSPDRLQSEKGNSSSTEQHRPAPPEPEPSNQTTPIPEPKLKANIGKVEQPKAQPNTVSTSPKRDRNPTLAKPVGNSKRDAPSASKQQRKPQPKPSQPAAPITSPDKVTTQPGSFKPTTVNLSQYAPPTLNRVPIRERVATFGGRTKPMQPLVQSQRFTQVPTNPFELVQVEYKKPLFLGLKIFGGVFVVFLLITCICCAAMM